MTPAPARLAGAALLASALLVPATASAATLQLNRQCYTKNQPVAIRGSGFPPASTQYLFLNGARTRSGVVTASGALSVPGGGAPDPPRSRTAARTYTLTASGSTSGSPVTARTTFRVVHTNITVTPALVTPGFVTYRALGFTYGRTLYLHYLRGTRYLRTRRIGALSGPCGTLRKKVRMFLFRPVKPAAYVLVFDNSARYSASYRPNFSFQALVPYTFT